MTEETSDKLFIEWVYIVDVEANALHVLACTDVENVREGLKQIGPATVLHDGTSKYAHWHVATVPLDADSLPSIQRPCNEEDEEG